MMDSPSSSFIKVLYGPYEAHGIIRHKIQKIYGLIDYLESNGLPYSTCPSPHLNRLTIEMNDRVIYTCDIRFMKFNLRFEEGGDLFTRRMIDAINLHQTTFMVASNEPTFGPLSEGMRALRAQPEYTASAISVDLDAPCNSLVQFQVGAGEEMGEWDGMGKHTPHPPYTPAQYAFNYGHYMTDPYEESEPSAPPEPEKEEGTSIMAAASAASTSSSCVCLSLDPPSLYSVCYGPPTPINTEAKADVDASEVDLNKASIDEELWRDIKSSMEETIDVATSATAMALPECHVQYEVISSAMGESDGELMTLEEETEVVVQSEIDPIFGVDLPAPSEHVELFFEPVMEEPDAFPEEEEELGNYDAEELMASMESDYHAYDEEPGVEPPEEVARAEDVDQVEKVEVITSGKARICPVFYGRKCCMKAPKKATK